MKNHRRCVVPACALLALVAAACASAPAEESAGDPGVTGTVRQPIIIGPRDIPSGPWDAYAYQDTFVGEDTPALNHGTEPVLRVGSAGHDRSLIQPSWTRQQLPPANPGTIVSATLTVTIAASSGWGSSGGAIGIHRVTSGWAEEEANWNCGTVSCPHNSWRMGKNNIKLHPYEKTPTATAIVTNGQTGTITFDVTADAAAVAAPTNPAEKFGWIIRKVDEDVPGTVDFGSRESATPPAFTVNGILTQVSSVCRVYDCPAAGPTICGGQGIIAADTCTKYCFNTHFPPVPPNPLAPLSGSGWAGGRCERGTVDTILLNHTCTCSLSVFPPRVPYP